MPVHDQELSRPYVGRKIPAVMAALAGAAAILWKAVGASAIPFVDGKSLALYGWIGLGSAAGGMARFWCSGVAARWFGETFPWGTLAINVAGSFVIGFFATMTGPEGRVFVSSTARQFVMVGICGGFTTFSSFSLQTLNLANDGEWLQAGGNVCGSVLLCLAAVWAGHAAAAGLGAR
ncbi:MAG TPA: fluoride efflux transporter CrcB [Xanthobacteraceae bacterium]|nr:fluoride efflux transporter CrcB [Xanthobacteraceae bacterium]